MTGLAPAGRTKPPSAHSGSRFSVVPGSAAEARPAPPPTKTRSPEAVSNILNSLFMKSVFKFCSRVGFRTSARFSPRFPPDRPSPADSVQDTKKRAEIKGLISGKFLRKIDHPALRPRSLQPLLHSVLDMNPEAGNATGCGSQDCNELHPVGKRKPRRPGSGGRGLKICMQSKTFRSERACSRSLAR